MLKVGGVAAPPESWLTDFFKIFYKYIYNLKLYVLPIITEIKYY